MRHFFRTTPKKNSVSELWVIFRGSPRFSGHSHLAIISTLNFGDCPGQQKSDPQWQKTWSWPELRRNGSFYVRPKSIFFAKNAFFPKKNTQNLLTDQYLFGKRVLFSLHNMVFIRKWMFILGLKSWFLAEKSDFCLMTPNFVNDPFVVLGETVHFPPWDRFFDFFVPTWPTHQKVFPPPHCGGTVCQ